MGVDLFEHHVHRVDVLLHAHVCRINHVQQQGRLSRLLQGGLERRHQVMRQVTDKPYGIRQHRFTDVCNVNTAQRRVQGRKQLVCGINLGLGYLVKQGGFTGVGIPHQRHRRDVGFGACPTPLLTLFLDSFQTREDLGNSATQQTTVGFELGFTRAAQTNPAFLSFKVGPATHQTRCQMTQLRQLNLQFPFVGTCTLSKNV